MSTPDWNAQARQAIGNVFAYHLHGKEPHSILDDKPVAVIAAALAAAYQQGQESGFMLGFGDGVAAVDKFGVEQETAEEAWAYRQQLAARPAGTTGEP